jgi:hypothetical protein
MGGTDWIHLAQDRNKWRVFVNTVINLRGSIKCWEILEQLSDCRVLSKSDEKRRQFPHQKIHIS